MSSENPVTCPSAGRPKAICVLGMHRSGTSTVSRAVNLLGAYLGKPEEIMQPAPENPEGFWERIDIMVAQDKLLAAIGQRWDTPLPLREGFQSSAEAAPHRQLLAAIIAEAFGGQPLWAWKDPRCCILFPLWQELVAEAGADLVVVYVIRNPVDVAASLAKRNGFPAEKSYGIWLNYNLSALKCLADVPLVFISYDSLLDDPERQLRRLTDQLAIPWPTDDATLKTELASYLRKDLRHSRTIDNALHDVPPMVRELQLLLFGTAENRVSIDSGFYSRINAMEKLFREQTESFRQDMESHFRNECLFIPESKRQTEQLQQRMGKLQDLVAERDGQLAERDRDLAALQARHAELQHTLAERDRQAAECERLLDDLTAQLAARQQTLTERDEQLAESSRALAGLNARVEELQHTLIERDGQLTTRGLELADLQGQLTEVQSTLVERDRQITALDRHLADQATRLAEQQLTLSERDHRITLLDQQLAEQAALLAERQQSLDEHKAEIDLLNATSEARERALRAMHEEQQRLTAELERLQCLLSSRETACKQHQLEVRATEQALAETRTNLGERFSELATLTKLLESSRQQLRRLDELQERIKEIRAENTTLQAEKTSLAQRLDERFKELAVLTRMLDDSQKELELSRSKVEEFRNSLTWRLTAPMRTLAKPFVTRRK